MLMIVFDKKVPTEKYFIRDNRILHKVVRDDDKLFPALVVPITFNKYILYEAHNSLHHNGTSKTYQCLRQVYY